MMFDFMQMGSILKFRYTTLELTANSSDEDKINDHNVGEDDNNKILDGEECSVDECGSDKDLGEPCQPGSVKVPRKPRTTRVLIGHLTSIPGGDRYEFHSAEVMIDEKNSRKSEKCPLDEDYVVSDGVVIRQLSYQPGEDACQCRSGQVIIGKKNSRKSEKCPANEGYIVSDRVMIRQLACEPGQDAYQYGSAQVMINEKHLRKSRKRSFDEDFIVPEDDDYDYGVESSNKRPKNVEKKTVAVRKKQAPQVYNHPLCEMPQSLQDYIGRLNLEAPPLFVAQKVVYASDVRRNQHRLSLPNRIINPDFFDKYLTDYETKLLKENGDVEVSLMDNKMHKYHNLNFKKWNMNSTTYVLKTGWNDVVKDNKLEEMVLQQDDNLEDLVLPNNRKENAVTVMKEDDKLKTDVVAQVWCFRKEARPWFALNIQAMTECYVTGKKTEDGRDIITKLL